MDEPTSSADALDDPTAPVAPAVVAVVVAHEPGPWFEECISSLAAQDYPSLSVLVIDTASAEEVKPRVAATFPDAFVRRLDANPGFGTAANEVLEIVEGAAFYLFCHDDVALAPDATRLLVEEAYRSNAGIVSPKVVSWEDDRRLLQVGVGLDHVGYAVPLVDRGELDQGQHDAVRDVFTAPGGGLLVRSDLFAALGGFDEVLDYLVDDVSLSWRAHLAGARVVVAPSARVRHREELADRRPDVNRRQRLNRHRLRVVLSCYSSVGLLTAVPKIAVINLLEVVYAVLVGRTAQARDVAGAWVWNLRRLGDLRAARRHVNQLRQVPDRDVKRHMAGGSARFNQFLRGQVSGEDRLTGLARSRQGLSDAMQGRSLRLAIGVWAAVLLVLAVGSRHLVTRGVPAVGDLVPFTSSPFDLLRSYVGGWRTAGLGSEAPAPTAFGLLGSSGVVFLGAMGLLRTVLTVGLVPLGALLAYRMSAPLGSRQAQVAALLVYVANPLPYNALAAGRWGSLALYAALPAVVAQLARMSGQAPFAGRAAGEAGDPGEGAVTADGRSFRQRVLGLGLLTAVLAALVPVAVVIVPAMALALVLGSALVYRTGGSGRLLAGALGASGVAFALHVPWSLDFVLPGTPLSVVTGTQAVTARPDLAALLRFDVGPLGSGVLGYALLVAAALPLLIGRDERHAWAVRGWTLAVTFWALAWVGQRGDLPFALPPEELLLVPAAVGLAMAAAMGVAAFQVDLPGYRFGWRQAASGVAAAAVVAGVVPVLGASFDGHWHMPSGDHSRALSFVDAENDEAPFRVLWIGDPSVLPLGSWELDEGLGYATTDGGTPGVEDLWLGSDDGRTGLLADAVDLARREETSRLGRLLAPMGVRYVVVPERLAPAPFSSSGPPVPGGVTATLDAQLDLEPLDVPAGLNVYRNQAWYSPRAVVSGERQLPTGGASATVDLDLSRARPALPDEEGRLRWSGPSEAGTQVLLSASYSDRWELTVDGEVVEHTKAFGWANGFVVESSGDATLRFRTPPLRYGIVLVQAIVWLWVIRSVLAGRRARSGAAR